MAFRNLTNIGKEYLATRLANQLPVKFTKAKIGNGSVPLATDPAQTTDLYGFKKQVTILKTIQEQNSIKLTVQITNDEINEGFYLKEIGIYVDNNGEEVLYWYCNEDNSQYINAQTDTPLSFEVDIVMEVTNINSTVVEWNGKDTWINKEFLKEELDKKLSNGNLPATIANAETIFKALQGNTGIKFDENLLYLNDSGTKKKGYCYIDKLTDGIFECIQGTTTTVNNATYFKNFSNKENSDRLSNLNKYEQINLKEKYPNHFNNVTFATIYRKGNNVIFTIDTGVPVNEKTLYFFPQELKYLMPKNFVFSVMCDTKKSALPIFLDPWKLTVETYSNELSFYSALYGQISWVI